ncbi:MAG TPA: HDOD domain-containing protein, partial [Planctomycetes bacterium]|nr:HDOD domain-containing protein [Planctomycetota bacterium]
MFKERFEELKHSGKLPSPSSVGMRILMLTQDEECDLDDVVEALQVDPALTGRVIRLATSVHHGGAKLTSVRSAAIRVGLRAVCNTALSFTVVSGNRTGKCEGFDYDEFWSCALATAVAAETIGRELRISVGPEAFTLGLLVGIGKLALASVHPEQYAGVLARARGKGSSALIREEEEELFINHREVAAALLEDWGLPEHFSEVALYFDGRTSDGEFACPQTKGLLGVLNVAEVMARVLVSDPERQPYLWPGLKRLCKGLSISASQMCELFDTVAEAWKEWGDLLHVPTSCVISAREIEEISKPGSNPKAAKRKGLRILAVDDDPVSLRLLVALLKRDGHEVMTAGNGKEALALYLEHGAQVVITDWMMPEMDGVMLCRQLRKTEEGRKLYILILTGRTEQDRIVEAFEVGVDDHIG